MDKENGLSAPLILGISTGVPSMRHTQQSIYERFARYLGTDARRSRAIRAIFERAGVNYRYSAVGEEFYAEDKTTQARNDRYMEAAIPLGESTIRRALDAAGYAPEDIDDLVIVSCTGFSIPGLDLHLAGRLGMRTDLRRTCVLGMGCYGAFPGLMRAREAVRAEPGRLACVLALELCSLHLQRQETAENVVSAALFADGAAAAMVGDEAHRHDGQNTPQPRLIDAKTHCDYQTLEHMAFTVTDHGFRMYLSSYVPELLAAQVQGFVDSLLQVNGLKRDDVRFWGVHPGSTKIVDYVQAQLGLRDEQVEDSHAVLGEYGNMSSATILFVLDRIHTCGHPSPGDYGVLLAFGPGLTMESLLVQW
jgi:predicted naringenin-chalcone synthase